VYGGEIVQFDGLNMPCWQYRIS